MKVAPWPPSRYSPPLSPDFPSVFARYRDVFRIAWQAARGYQLEEWQEDLLCHVTEINPATGLLRRRQVLVSVARQNGKTEIAAALGLLFLLWKTAPYVVGIASSVEQARLVYRRAMQVIGGNPGLKARFEALTDTRGIRGKDGSLWELKAAKTAALQGLPIDLGIVDEVHLVKEELWGDLLNGTGGRPDVLLVGITTAGDDDSSLLKRLYAMAESAETGDSFGHFIWESPEDTVSDDDEVLGAHLQAASPAIASGRVDLATVLEDVRTLPIPDVVRYRLNRFTATSSTLIGAGAWAGAQWGDGEDFPTTGARPVFGIDRTPNWEYASIVAAARVGEVIWTEVVASIPRPTMERLLDITQRLLRHSPLTFAMDRYQLGDLANELKKRGMPVRAGTQGDMASASALLYSKLAHGNLRHRGDPLMSVQVPRTVRRNVGDGFRISRADSSVEVDAVVATAQAVLAAEVEQEVDLAIF